MRTQLTFAAPPIDVGAAQKTADGAIILKAKPARSGDYEYFGFELPGTTGRNVSWDDRLIGRISPEEFERILPQFKGLAITNEHIWVPVGERSEVAIGTMLTEGEIDAAAEGEDAWAVCEALLHEPKAILRIVNHEAQELSIGFESSIRWSDGGEGEPDFYIEEVQLNHVALVKEGRAGADGRLLNHKAKLENNPMKTISIGGKDFQVDDAVADEFSRLSTAETDLGTQLANAKATLETTQGSLATTAAERDDARGQLAVASSQLTALQNNKPDIAGEAVRMANAHTAFADEAKRMGHEGDLVLGAYDENAVKIALLNKAGAGLAEDASADTIKGAWAFAVASLGKDAPKPKSVIDNAVPVEPVIEDGAMTSTNTRYFGGGK